MLPERKLVAIRVKADGHHLQEAVTLPPRAVAEPSLAVGLMFWANLFALSIIAALF
jgi:hypothetical protein